MLSLSRKSNSTTLSIITMMFWVVAMMTMHPSSYSMISVVSSFQPMTKAATTTMFSSKSTITSSSTSLNVFGTKKSKKMTPEELEKYWEGEWVCKDCGYIYNRVRC